MVRTTGLRSTSIASDDLVLMVAGLARLEPGLTLDGITLWRDNLSERRVASSENAPMSRTCCLTRMLPGSIRVSV